MRSSYFIAGGIALVAALWIGSGLIVPNDPEAREETAAESAEAARLAPAPRVRVADLSAQESVVPLVVHGRTQALRAVEVRAETSGRVVEVLVNKGEAVSTGTVLARLDVGDRPRRLEQARALVAQRDLEHSAAASLAQRDFGSRTRLAGALAELEKARAELATIQRDLDNTVIRAPFDGVVEARAAEVGDLPGAGGAVATIIDLNPLKIEVQIAERLIGRVNVGVPVTVRLIDGQEADGVVRWVSRRADPQTRTFAAEVEIANPDGTLRDGMTAEVVLPLKAVFAHRASPAVLTLSDSGRVGVMLVDAQDRAVFAPVDVVRDGPDGMWLAGLPEHIRLITVGQDYVVPGQTVQPVPDEAMVDVQAASPASPVGVGGAVVGAAAASGVGQ